MAICSTCNSVTARLRQRWQEGTQLPDECPNCAPQAFDEAVHLPSDQKIWIGPEYAPRDYEKHYDSEGVYYQMKPEASEALERQMCGVDSVAAKEEREATEKAIAHKRATARTKPMSLAEHEQALRFADRIFRPLIEDQTTAYDA